MGNTFCKSHKPCWYVWSCSVFLEGNQNVKRLFIKAYDRWRTNHNSISSSCCQILIKLCPSIAESRKGKLRFKGYIALCYDVLIQSLKNWSRFVDVAQMDVVSSPVSVWNDYYGSLCCVCVCMWVLVFVMMCVVTIAAVGYKWKTFPRSTLLLDKRHYRSRTSSPDLFYHHTIMEDVQSWESRPVKPSHFYFSRLLFVCRLLVL